MKHKKTYRDITLQQDDLSSDGLKPGLLEKTENAVKKPSMYEVVLLNDDFTPMDFVVLILKRFFHKTDGEAQSIMLQIHHSGQGLCGIYTKDVAETKMSQVISSARDNGYPLKCVIRKN